MKRPDQNWKLLTSMNFDKNQGALIPMPLTEKTFNALVASSRNQQIADTARHCFHNKLTGEIESNVYHVTKEPGLTSQGYLQCSINGQKAISTEWLRNIYQLKSLVVHHHNQIKTDDRLINLRFMTKSEHHCLHARKYQDDYYSLGLKTRFPNYSNQEIEQATYKRIVRHLNETTIRA